MTHRAHNQVSAEASGKELVLSPSQRVVLGGAMVKWPKYFYPLTLMKIGGWIEYHSIKIVRKILDEKNYRKVPFWWENDLKKSFYQ